uniref:Uncharacterized protein n=1 Tax=Glossina brevipalpis TaxID=37001 RepID=A0A1A9WCJ4_9MUSC
MKLFDDKIRTLLTQFPDGTCMQAYACISSASNNQYENTIQNELVRKIGRVAIRREKHKSETTIVPSQNHLHLRGKRTNRLSYSIATPEHIRTNEEDANKLLIVLMVGNFATASVCAILQYLFAFINCILNFYNNEDEHEYNLKSILNSLIWFNHKAITGISVTKVNSTRLDLNMLTANSQAQSPSAPTNAAVPHESQHSSFFDSQIFRWISLILYMAGISGMGIIVSLYYLIFFDSRIPEIYTQFPISIRGQLVFESESFLQFSLTSTCSILVICNLSDCHWNIQT